MKKLLIALTPAGAAALLAGGGTFSSFAELDAWSPAMRPAARAPRAGGMTGIVKTKKVLLAVMAIAAAAYLGTGGTFATFSADTSNNGDAISSGTLTMDNQVNSGSVCYSANGAVNNNPNCDKVVNVTNVAPGVFTSTDTASVTVRNSGSLDATNFYLSAPYVNATLSSPFTTAVGSGLSATLSITSLEGPITSGDTIRVTNGNNTQDFTASASYAGGVNSVSATYNNNGPGAAAFTFGSGSIVTDLNSNTSSTTTDCYDVATQGTLTGTTGGANLPFVVSGVANNPFCTTVAMWVQETTGGPASSTGHYCWYGYQTAAGVSAGACTAPLGGITLSGTRACNSNSTLALSSALNGNILNGDTIAVTDATAGNTCTYTASGNYYVGNTGPISVAYASCTPMPGCGTTPPTLASGSTVSDTKSLSDLNAFSSNTLNTISNFDTTYGHGGHLQLYPVGNNGSINTTAGLVRLAHFNSGTYARTFQIGFYFPAPNNTNQNTLQGIQSTFGLTWHIEQ